MEDVKKQIVASIKEHSNILVTVSTDPSVDELSAALGLTLVLDVLDKRATAVVSGMIPPAIKFLDPDKTFDTTADSLRDFIIALNKEKADHLRYKVEGDVVKIFITPYKTTLTQEDLEFSQGDYNVDLVLALGVKDQDHLDKALAAHGKILHDATLVTVSAGSDKSTLGSIDWHEDTASSVSEMVTSLIDLLKEDKPLLSEQIATALLTGIVAATDRFSNNRTTSQVMTMAAQLMAAGANQQLIAAKLEEAHEIGVGPVAGDPQAKRDKDEPDQLPKQDDPTELTIERDAALPTAQDAPEAPAAPEPLQTAGETPPKETLDQLEFEKQLSDIPGMAPAAPAGETLETIEQELENAAKEDAAQPESEPAPAPATDDTQPLTAASDASMPGFEPTPPPAPVVPVLPPVTAEPSQPVFTTPVEAPQIITNHGDSVPETPVEPPVINASIDEPHEGEAETVDPFASAPTNEKVEVPPLQPVITEPAGDTTANLGTPEGAALLAASDTEPVAAPVATVEPQPAPVVIPTLPPLPPLPADVSIPLPPPPPLPPLSQPPTVMPSGAVSGDIFNDGSSTPPPAVPAPASPPEPGQFRIPGQ